MNKLILHKGKRLVSSTGNYVEVLRIRRSQLEISVTYKFVKVLKWLPTKQSCLALVSIEVSYNELCMFVCREQEGHG